LSLLSFALVLFYASEKRSHLLVLIHVLHSLCLRR
jgi:hypothetical protein